jgi:hypothetical protein
MYSSRNGRHCGFVVLALVVCGCVAGLPSAACGDLAVSSHLSFPDLSCFGVTVNYEVVGDVGTLTIDGFTGGYTDPSGADASYLVGWQSLHLSATLAPSSDAPIAVSTGTVAITDGSEALLEGTVDLVGFGAFDEIDFGYDEDFGGEHIFRTAFLDFTFHVTGGSLQSDYGALAGTTVTLYYDSINDSMNIPPDVPFSADGLASSFCSANCNNVSDSYSMVPEPASGVLVLSSIFVGLAASVMRRSWKRRD